MNSAFGLGLADYPNTIHLRAAEEKQNGFPFLFDFRKRNFFNERGGCTEKHKNGNKVFNGKLFNLSSLILNGEKSKYNALFTKTVEH